MSQRVIAALKILHYRRLNYFDLSDPHCFDTLGQHFHHFYKPTDS
jgi:hypothetical protein